MGSFYLDVLKDRLYTFAACSRERRSGQTALYRVLEAMVRVMAPVLSFTAEEICVFKQRAAGSLLVQLGYVEDDRWGEAGSETLVVER